MSPRMHIVPAATTAEPDFTADSPPPVAHLEFFLTTPTATALL